MSLESAADEVNEKIINKLNLSFITPIDREDIYSIAGELATGGWRIIKAIGGKIFKLEPISDFAADLNSSVVVFSATLLHLPSRRRMCFLGR